MKKSNNSLWLTVIIPFLFSSCKLYEKNSNRTPLQFEQVIEKGLEGCREYYSVPAYTWAVLNNKKIITGEGGFIYEGSNREVQISDHFQIGSLGKSITSLIAAKCVENGLINWDSKLFSVYPEWESTCQSEYRNLTLSDLLTHQTSLPPFNKHKTHIDKITGKLVYDDIPNFTGNITERRMAFCQYALSQKPNIVEGLNYGNSGYVLAGCMLEKVSGQTWEELALQLASELEMEIGFDRPNLHDSLQPWGHLRTKRKQLEPISAKEIKKYNDPIFSAAGNINVNILDFSKYVRQFMDGLNNKNAYVSSESFKFLLANKKPYAYGWYNNFDTDSIYFHYGSEGTFYCHMMIFANLNSAIIIFTNGPGDADTENFINDVRNYLKDKYIYGKEMKN